jgi:hypothetical protein
LDAQRGCHLLEVGAGEIAAVVDIELVRDAAYRPSRIVLTPNRLP